MTDLLAEVDEIMRRERMEAIWRNHAPKIIGLIAALILSTGIYSFYSHWSANAKMKDTDAMIAIMESPEFPGNVKAADLKMRDDVKGMTMLLAAKAYIAKDKKEEALALYKQIVADTSIEKDIQQLGLLMQVRLEAENKNNDAGALSSQLESIYNNNASPWRYLARLDAAVLQAGKQDYKAAQAILEPIIQDETVPQPLAAKARALDHVYTMRSTEKNPGIKDAQKGSKK